ncbi:MAG TPA: chorismate synthase, partial [Clostridiaceae bacterium]|nr:chorismate synthase [Clostridiaceae bacterium]
RMKEAILKAKEEEDSVGGIIECLVIGVPGGKGDPGMESVESVVSRHIFAVPAVKGIEFGTGFRLATMRGSESNDAFYHDEDGVKTRTNHNGGINGGITNGMPINFSVIVKPTSSIGRTQETVNMRTKENTEITVKGRHDPCIVHRAVPVIEAAAALALCEILKV